MKALAITRPGQEYLYKASSAHKVSAASANVICAALNDARYGLRDGEAWHVYDMDLYDAGYDYAMYQQFSRRNGNIYVYGRG